MIDKKQVAVASAPESGVPDGWREVRFDEIAQLVNDRVDNPAEAGVERYVGLEHLDPESLKIRRWGAPTDVEAQKLRFQAGDIIFGKRRAYQRKVAVADFEGICSAHAMVLRAREENVVKEFLPFFMQSDTFFDRALSISVGSLSPTINWKTLAGQKFVLPPKDEQQRIADLLWAADEVVTNTQNSLDHLSDLSSLMFERALKKHQWREALLGEILFSVQYGLSLRAGDKVEGSVPLLRIPNVVKGGLDLSDLVWIVLSSEEKERFSVYEGDILIVRTNGNPEYVGRSVVIEEPLQDAVYASYLIRIRVDKSQAHPAYVNALLNSNYLRTTLRHEIRSSAGNYNLNTNGIKRQRIPLPSLVEQEHILNWLSLLKAKAIELDQHIANSVILKKALMKNFLDVSIEGHLDVQ